MVRILFLLSFFLVALQGMAQGVDSLFMQARQLAFNGEREKARELCNRILEVSPRYSDVRILLGRTYSWDGKRNEARTAFSEVLAYDSANTEAWSALADVELWDDQPEASLKAAENGLRFNPGNTGLATRKIKALIALQQCDPVFSELLKLKQSDSACTECRVLYDKAYEACANRTFAAGTTIEHFSNTYGTAYYNFVQIGMRTPKNTIILRINQSSRFNKTGFQPEVDMYPSLGKKMYGYINYGYTPYDLFPKHRLGLELYRSLPRAFEVSLGGRYMNFGGGSEVFIYTGSVTKYLGNYALIGRIFITPDTRSFSRSGIINLRRYYADADNYIGLTASAGFSPDQRALLTTAGLDSTDQAAANSIYFFKSQRVGFACSKTFRFKHVLLLNLDYTNQELTFTRKEYVNVFGASLTYRFRF